jgi:hypothetical protein
LGSETSSLSVAYGTSHFAEARPHSHHSWVAFVEQKLGIIRRRHPVGPGWNEAIERYAAAVFCNSHDILHRHRAPCVATRARRSDPRPRRRRRSQRRQSLGTEDAMQRVEEMARARIGQMIDDSLGFPAPFDHTGLTQRAELLGQRRLANAELLLDFAHRVFALAKEASNQQPLRVAEELEDFRDLFGAAVQPSRLLLPPGLSWSTNSAETVVTTMLNCAAIVPILWLPLFYGPTRLETVEEGGEIEAGLRIILRDADLEPRVCADPMLIGMAQNLGRPRRQWSSTPLYRGI